MLKITEEGVKGLEMSFTLDDRQRAVLMSFVKQEGFDILQLMMEQELRLINTRLVNTDSADPKAVLANHAIVRAAGMWYAGFIQRINQLINEAAHRATGIGSPMNPEVPAYQEELR